MKLLAKILSGLALAGTLVPALFFFADRIEGAALNRWLLAAAVVWFVATPVWMEHKATD